MSTFLDAAYRVLREAGRPMTAEEITERSRGLEIIPSTGRTPSQTMKSKLSTSILKERDRSPFMRTEAGRFALREWDHREYVAERYAKSLLREEAMVFPASHLSLYVPQPGLWEISPDLGKRLADECRPMERLKAEADHGVIQMISGFVVQHRGRVLTYKRTRRLPEARLHGEFSAMFGGHLNPQDIALINIFEPGNADIMERELNQELRLRRDSYEILLRGLLYDNAREVSRQHLAVVFDVTLSDPSYTIGERGFLQQDKFESWDEVGLRLDEFENWSQLLYRLYAGR